MKNRVPKLFFLLVIFVLSLPFVFSQENTTDMNETEECTPYMCLNETTFEGMMECGLVNDTCGGFVDCGGCAEGMTCQNNTCVNQTQECTPFVCLNETNSNTTINCGVMNDTCGGAIDCGSCPSGMMCSDTNVCVNETTECTTPKIGDQNNGKKTTICHVPPGNPSSMHTIIIGNPAVPAHLAHGDFLGACECADLNNTNSTNLSSLAVDEKTRKKAGTKPGSFMWKLDLMMEKISLGLTFDKTAKEKKKIANAEERLSEAQVLSSEKKFSEAEEAFQAYEEDLSAVIEESSPEVKQELEKHYKDIETSEPKVPMKKTTLESTETTAKGRPEQTNKGKAKTTGAAVKGNSKK